MPEEPSGLLFVDDETDNVELAAEILEDALSTEVVVVDSVEKAVELLHDKQWKAVIMDLFIPLGDHPNRVLGPRASRYQRDVDHLGGLVLLEEIERLQAEPVTAEELAKARTRARAGLVRQMNSNNGITSIMTSTQALKGDWRDAWHGLDRIDAVTAEDIQRVASEYFTPSNRTVAISKPLDPAS